MGHSYSTSERSRRQPAVATSDAGVTSLDRSFETSSQDPEPDWVSGDFGHRVVTLYCADNGHPRPVMLRCGDRTCGRCRGKDFYRLYRAYRKALGKMKSPKLVTLTLQNVADLTKAVVQRLRAAFTKLRRREPWVDRIRGGVYSIELVNKGRGWHVHMHLVVDADYLPQGELSEDWREVTGDAFIVDVRRAWSPQDALKYILKYLLKPPQILDGEEAVYNEVLKGIRLVQPFGSFYREIKQEKPPVVCSECGCTGWITEFDLRRAWREWRDT